MKQERDYYVPGIFRTHFVRIQLKNTSSKLKIIPVGDIHRDSMNCDEERWKNFISKAKKEDDEYTYYIGMGDYNDFASWSERKKIRNMDLHESTIHTLDDIAMKSVMNITREMSFMKGRMIGMLSGNHEWVFIDGKSATQDMCERLQCKYLGALSYIRILISFKNDSLRTSLDLFAAHGIKAGGKMVGTSINQVDDMRLICPSADIYFMGHNHDKTAKDITTLDFTTGREEIICKQKKQWLCRTGGFLRGYTEDVPSYVANRMLRPTSLGTLKLECSFKHKQVNLKRNLIKDIHAWI